MIRLRFMNSMMSHDHTAEVLGHIHREIQRMSIDVTALKASADKAEAMITTLIALVEKALASQSTVTDAAVQASLDAIKASLDTASAAGDAEVAKATPAPVPAPVAPTGATGA